MSRHIAPMVIRDVMTPSPRTVGPATSVLDLQHLFIAYGFNAFPVVDGSNTLLGIVTKLDLLRIFRHGSQRLLPDLSSLWAENVADIMRRRVVTLAPDDAVTAAVDHMLSARLRSLPVVIDRGRKALLVGIVSRGDVLGALMLDSSTSA